MAELDKQQSLCIRVREYDEDPSRERERGRVADNYHEYILEVTTEVSSSSKPSAAPSLQQSVVTNVSHLESNRRRRFLNAPSRVVQDLFLPIGFPSSVSPGYLEYQLYDSVQGLSSYLRGVLCNAQVLNAVGVGKAEATALSAAMTWAMKDGVSMMGGLLFSYSAAPLFDSHVKEFRLFADLINDVGLTLDMLAPYFEGNLLLVASAAGLCKSLCGLSAGATKSSITLHFAREGNMADLNAKESTQETLVSLIGMLLGIALAQHLRKLEEMGYDNALITRMQWIIFAALTILHVWSNWKGVELLRMRTLNRERAELVFDDLLNELFTVMSQETKLSPSEDDNDDESIARIQAAIQRLPATTDVHESLLISTSKMLWPGNLRLSAHLTEVLECDMEVIRVFEEEQYILNLNSRNEVLASLLTGARPEDQMKAFIHGLYLFRYSSLLQQQHGLVGVMGRRELIRQTLDRVNLLFFNGSGSSSSLGDGGNASNSSLMFELKRKGWEVEDRLYLGFSRRRSRWILDKTD